MLVRIPAARKPDRMFDIVFPACHIAMRIGFSSLVYHDEVTAMISTLSCEHLRKGETYSV
jgi:hypothetical protein